MRHLQQQQNGHAAVAAIDPRTRLLAAALLLGLVVSSSSSSFPLQVAGICLPIAVITGMSPRILLLRMLHPLFIAAMVILLKTFMGTGNAVELFTAGPLVISGRVDGLHEGSLIASRILGAVSVALLLSQVMTFTETMAAMAWLRVHRGLVDVCMFAWRSLFMLYDDAAVVYTAQKNRLGYCGMLRSLRSFGTMAGMLVIRAFDNSHAMTVAMAQRGYDGSLPLLSRARLDRRQLAGLAVFACMATVAWKLQN